MLQISSQSSWKRFKYYLSHENKLMQCPSLGLRTQQELLPESSKLWLHFVTATVFSVHHKTHKFHLYFYFIFVILHIFVRQVNHCCVNSVCWVKKHRKSCKENFKSVLVKILRDWNNSILISLLIFWVIQYVLHIVIILGDMPARKKQDPQIKDLADNFVDYFIM